MFRGHAITRSVARLQAMDSLKVSRNFLVDTQQLPICFRQRSVNLSRFSTQRDRFQTGVVREARVWMALSISTFIVVGAYKILVHDRLADAPNAAISKAQKAAKEGDTTEAVRKYQQALGEIETKPGTFGSQSRSTVLFALAETLEEQGDIRGAEYAYRSAAQAATADKLSGLPEEEGLSRTRALSLDRLGQLLQERGEFATALSAYLESLALLVGDPMVIEKCWKSYQKKPQDEDEQVKLDVEPIRASYNPGEVRSDNFASQADWRGMLVDTTRAKDAAGILNNIGMLYLENGREQEARAIFGRCLAVAQCCIPMEDRDKSFRKGLRNVKELYMDGTA